jgi:hypothetical protein
MSESTPEPSNTPASPAPQPAGSTTTVRGRERMGPRVRALSQSRVAVLAAGVVLGAVITGAGVVVGSELGDDDHGRGSEHGAYQSGEHGDGERWGHSRDDGYDSSGDRDGSDAVDPEDAGTPGTSPARPAAPVAPAHPITQAPAPPLAPAPPVAPAPPAAPVPAPPS